MEALSISRAMSPDTCLVLMFKAPGRSKQRLAETIGPLAAVAAEHLFDCAREDLRDWQGPTCFAPATAQDERWLRSKVQSFQSTVRQRGADLGARINHVNRSLEAAGFTRQMFIGIDCPELDPEYFERACRLLDEHDAVFGPAQDGGVVLMAARQAWPDLRGLDWGGAALGDELTGLTNRQGWRTTRLACRSDVDTVEDLRALPARLGRDARPARRKLSSWIAALDLTRRCDNI